MYEYSQLKQIGHGCVVDYFYTNCELFPLFFFFFLLLLLGERWRYYEKL